MSYGYVFRMEDGTILKTDNASKAWDEATRFDGHNRVSCATGSQWNHQTLHRSRKGRYYLVYESNWQGSQPHAEWVSPQEATRWLLSQEHELPADLEQYREAIEE